MAVNIGKTAEASFTMKVGGLSESVDVLGESPLVDVTSSSTDNSLTRTSCSTSRSATATSRPALLNNLPGVNGQSAYGGDASSGNALLIDGVDTRDPSGGTAWTFYNFNIVEEVQAVGIGAPGRVRRLLRRGDQHPHQVGRQPLLGPVRRHLHERAAWRATTSATRSSGRTPRSADPAKTKELLDITTQLGGPLDQGQAVLLRERAALSPADRIPRVPRRCATRSARASTAS